MGSLAMNDTYAWVEERTLRIGDHVRIRKDRWPLPGLVDQGGTVVRLISVPRDCCLVRVDGDTDDSRVWFFYHSEILAGDLASADR